jgi:glutathione S-transferase
MKFYNSLGPNPHVVRMFMKEKGLDVPFAEVDIMSGENRQGEYMKVNVLGQMPALELDDGTAICEITAICEYLEDKQPEPPLIGSTAEEKAQARMWTRRIDLNIIEPMANGFRFSEGLPLFQNRVHVIPQAADDLKQIAREKLEWLDGELAGKDYICGDRVTLADILLYCFLTFGAQVGQPLDGKLENLAAWYARVGARESASA